MKTTRVPAPRSLILGFVCYFALTACASSDPVATPAGGAGAHATAGAGGMPGSAGSTAAGAPAAAGSNADVAGASQGGAAPAGGSGGAPGSGGSATGGAPTAGSSGTGVGGAVGAGTCAGVFCDDFERAALGADWPIEKDAAGTVELVTTKAHSGTSSVHISFTTARTASFITETKGFPAPNNDYWGRVWLFMATGLEAGHHVYIEGSTGVNSGNTGIRALNTQGAGFLATNNAPPDTGGISGTVKMPQMVWTCFEWHIAAVGTKENTNLYMDGTEVAGTAASTTPAVTTLIKQRIGYERYALGVAGEMWVDDYAIGPTRINCN